MTSGIDLRSEKVSEIIGRIPPKIIRYGNLIFVGIFVLLLFIASLIPIPNKLICRVSSSDNNSMTLLFDEVPNKPVSRGDEIELFYDNTKIISGTITRVSDSLIIDNSCLQLKIEVLVSEYNKMDGTWLVIPQPSVSLMAIINKGQSSLLDLLMGQLVL